MTAIQAAGGCLAQHVQYRQAPVPVDRSRRRDYQFASPHDEQPTDDLARSTASRGYQERQSRPKSLRRCLPAVRRLTAGTVFAMGIDEWGNAVTSVISLVLLIAAVVMLFQRKRRVAAYLATAFYLLFFPIRLWFFQFELTQRGQLGVAYIVEVVVIQIILGGLVPLVVSCFFRFRPLLTGLLLAYVLSLLLQFFSYAYWTYGTTPNFNASLSHLDSFYFALGTLTTAGTGSISATSELARGYQTLQMGLDIALIGFVAVVVLARYSALLNASRPATAEGVAGPSMPDGGHAATGTEVQPPETLNPVLSPKPEDEAGDGELALGRDIPDGPTGQAL